MTAVVARARARPVRTTSHFRWACVWVLIEAGPDRLSWILWRLRMVYRHTLVLALLALLATAASCGDDGVTETDTVNGVRYSARFNGGGSLGPFINVVATLRNVSSAPQDRVYLVSCPVRIRLYRPADGFKVYDETQLACQSNVEATLSIGVGEAEELTSGIRQGSTVLGDSLPFQTYAVRAVLNTEGAGTEMEVVAGAWTFTQPSPGVGASRRQ